MNKKCEICGQEKPQHEFSKAYKHRCKACVAEAARQERKRYKDLEAECMQAIHPLHQFSQTTFTPNPRYVIATAAMQGILASEKTISLIASSPVSVSIYENVAIASVSFADELMKNLKLSPRHD